MARKSFEILAVATVAALFAVAVLAEDRIPRAIQGIDAPKVEKAEAESVRGYLIKDSEGRLQKCSREDFQRAIAEQAEARETLMEKMGKILTRPGQFRPGGAR